jgi:hypothetical protein
MTGTKVTRKLPPGLMWAFNNILHRNQFSNIGDKICEFTGVISTLCPYFITLYSERVRILRWSYMAKFYFKIPIKRTYKKKRVHSFGTVHCLCG